MQQPVLLLLILGLYFLTGLDNVIELKVTTEDPLLLLLNEPRIPPHFAPASLWTLALNRVQVVFLHRNQWNLRRFRVKLWVSPIEEFLGACEVLENVIGLVDILDCTFIHRCCWPLAQALHNIIARLILGKVTDILLLLLLKGLLPFLCNVSFFLH